MNIYVANLAPDVNEETLQAIFSPYGEIGKIKLMIDLQTNISKGYAFVLMPDDEQAVNAIQQINGMMLKNKKIAVREAGKPTEKNIVVPQPSKKAVAKPDLSIFDEITFTATVKFFDEEKGFGFLLLENQKELFFHHSSLPENEEKPVSGQIVKCNIQHTKKGFVGINITYEPVEQL